MSDDEHDIRSQAIRAMAAKIGVGERWITNQHYARVFAAELLKAIEKEGIVLALAESGAEDSAGEGALADALATRDGLVRYLRIAEQKLTEHVAALEQAGKDLAAAKSVSANAVETLARIASLDISATRSIEDLVAPWRRLEV